MGVIEGDYSSSNMVSGEKEIKIKTPGTGRGEMGGDNYLICSNDHWGKKD